MEEPYRRGARCVVVGAGLSGLACGLRLAELGHDVHVLDAGAAPGGRARTVWHRGRPVDRGFQVLSRAYPETHRFIDRAGIPRRDLRPLTGGAVFIGPSGVHRLAGSRGGLARFSGLAVADRARLVRLGAEAAARGASALRDVDGPSAEESLRARGFSEHAIDSFFRPLFGAVSLDHSLGADAGYFRFLLAMLGRGPVFIPSDGLGMLADWAAAALRQGGGTVRADCPVAALDVDARGERVVGARLADGELVEADWFVLAVDPLAARGLVEPIDSASAQRIPTDAASVVTAAFALSRPLYSGSAVLLNAGRRPGSGPTVDLLCQTTNIVRPGAPGGVHIVLASCVTTDGRSADGLAAEVERQVAEWAPRFSWADHAELIDVFECPFAQYRALPGVRASLPGPRTAVHNLVLAGDMVTNPSIEGAVASGRRAAGIIDALVP